MDNKPVKNFFNEREFVPGTQYYFGPHVEAESFVWDEKAKDPRNGRRLFRFGVFCSNGGEKCKFIGHKIIPDPKKIGKFKTCKRKKYIFFVQPNVQR